MARRADTRRNGAAIDGVLSGAITGSGVLQKDGGGTLVLTGANSYDGGTSLTGGRLLVNNTSGSGVGAGDVTVNATATNQHKDATCDTGLRTRVPAFINEGERIKVSTEDGSYIGRA